MDPQDDISESPGVSVGETAEQGGETTLEQVPSPFYEALQKRALSDACTFPWSPSWALGKEDPYYGEFPKQVQGSKYAAADHMWIQGLQPPAWGEVTPACQDGEDRCRAVFLACLCVRPPGGCVNCRLRVVGLGGPESCISNRVPAMLLLHGHTWGGSLQSPLYLGPTLWGEVRVRALPVRRG